MRIRGSKFGQVAVYGKAAGVSYQGPGDVVSGATAWGSSARAYNAAYATGSNAALDLLDQAGANPITINILSTGFIDVASINTWVAAHSVTTICVTKLYDQTGNTNHWTQATLASMPTLTMSAINGLPALTFASSQTINTTATFTSTTIGFSCSYKRTSGTALGGAFGTTSVYIGAGSVSGKAAISNGTELDVGTSITENAWHGLQGTLVNSPNAALNIDGTDNTGLTAGSVNMSAAGLRFGRAGTQELLGQVSEGGFWTGGFTAPNRASIYTNMHGSNGYNGVF